MAQNTSTLDQKINKLHCTKPKITIFYLFLVNLFKYNIIFYIPVYPRTMLFGNSPLQNYVLNQKLRTESKTLTDDENQCEFLTQKFHF